MKKSFVTLDKLREIINVHPTPFHLYDEKGIVENAKRLNEAFSWNKGFREYFAVKATPTPAILKLLKEHGCGVDCSSMAELVMSERCGFSGEDIVFSSNATPDEEFVKAAELGATINLDDITHIEVIKKLIKIPKKMYCRFNPGGAFEIGNAIMDHPGDAKYGMTREQIFSAFSELKALGVEEFGIHAFLASNTVSNDYYPVLAAQLFRLAVDLTDALGVRVTCIDLSGGIGIPYRPEQQPNDIGIIGEGVRRVYEEILGPAGFDVAIHTELGRFMLAPYGCLVTTAIREKHIYKEYIGVDSCACDLMRPAMYGAYHSITVMGKEDKPCDRVYDITGSLCENNDKFAIDRELPEIETGDILVIHDTGAHGRAMGYNYNGKLRCGEIMLRENGTFDEIRRGETLEDYFATLIW